MELANASEAQAAHLASVPSIALLDEIAAHLRVAISQSLPSDDQVIMEHVREAHGLAVILRKAQ